MYRYLPAPGRECQRDIAAQPPCGAGHEDNGSG